MQKDLAVLVLSYDGAHDLWAPFFELFFINWRDCPYKVYLLTNELDFKYSNVINVKSGKREDWADSVRKALAQIPEEYCLVFLEDSFLIDCVDEEKIDAAFKYMVKNEVDSLNLINLPKSRLKTNNKDYLARSPRQTYCVTFVYSIIRKTLFNSLCKPGFSPWDYEIKNSLDAYRSGKLPGKFQSAKKPVLRVWAGGAVVKGRFTRTAVKYCRKNGIALNLEGIKVLTRAETLKEWLRTLIWNMIPDFIIAKKYDSQY